MTPSPRILLTTYHQAYLKKGGGEFELFSISEKLKRHGLIADIYGPWSRALEHYDIVLHFSVHGGGLDLLHHVHDKGVPVALWPNIWLNAPAPQIEQLVREHIDLANAVIFKSRAEQDKFASFFDLPAHKTRNIITLADSIYTRPAPPGLFKSLYKLDRYAVGMGIIEPTKNQLAAIRALKGTGLKLVLIGSHRDAEYYQACKQEGGSEVLFIDALPARSEILRSALSEADVFIECSHEPPGLSSIEAGLTGVNLVLSDSPWTREHFGDMVEYGDPHDTASISAAISASRARPSSRVSLPAHLAPHCADSAIKDLVQILGKAIP